MRIEKCHQSRICFTGPSLPVAFRMRFGRASSPPEITVNRRPGHHPKPDSSSRIRLRGDAVALATRLNLLHICGFQSFQPLDLGVAADTPADSGYAHRPEKPSNHPWAVLQRDRLMPFDYLEPRGNPTQPITHRGVMGRLAGVEAFLQPRGFAKGMPGPKLGMEPLQLRGSPVWKEVRKWRNRPTGTFR